MPRCVAFGCSQCRHILVQKQSEALRISEEIHNGKITFNEAAFHHSEDKAGAHGLLGWKSQGELDQDFWKAALECKEGDWLCAPPLAPSPCHPELHTRSRADISFDMCVRSSLQA